MLAKEKWPLSFLVSALLLISVGLASEVSAQPSDANQNNSRATITSTTVIGQVESIGLSDEPKFEWHTPNFVSFNGTAVCTERANDIGGKERLARCRDSALP